MEPLQLLPLLLLLLLLGNDALLQVFPFLNPIDLCQLEVASHAVRQLIVASLPLFLVSSVGPKGQQPSQKS